MPDSILILDDEEDCLRVLKDFLDKMGFQVILALQPKGALELVRKHRPALVFFDYKMPLFDGDKFLAEAKSICPQSKYVLMTAYRDDNTVERFTKMGVYDVMIKPIDLAKLLSIVRKA